MGGYSYLMTCRENAESLELGFMVMHCMWGQPAWLCGFFNHGHLCACSMTWAESWFLPRLVFQVSLMKWLLKGYERDLLWWLALGIKLGKEGGEDMSGWVIGNKWKMDGLMFLSGWRWWEFKKLLEVDWNKRLWSKSWMLKIELRPVASKYLRF